MCIRDRYGMIGGCCNSFVEIETTTQQWGIDRGVGIAGRIGWVSAFEPDTIDNIGIRA